VSPDTEQIHRLRAKGFDVLYSDNSNKWNEMVVKATEYAKTFLEDTGEPVRPADVSAILRNAIKVDTQFEEYLGKKKLQQKYWVDWFSDYAVEQVYPLPIIK
jgi:hypothetical protein